MPAVLGNLSSLRIISFAFHNSPMRSFSFLIFSSVSQVRTNQSQINERVFRSQAASVKEDKMGGWKQPHPTGVLQQITLVFHCMLSHRVQFWWKEGSMTPMVRIWGSEKQTNAQGHTANKELNRSWTPRALRAQFRILCYCKVSNRQDETTAIL